VALVAPSGAGKSTLLHITGLLGTPRRRGLSRWRADLGPHGRGADADAAETRSALFIKAHHLPAGILGGRERHGCRR